MQAGGHGFESRILHTMAKFVNGYFQVDGEDIDRAIRATGAVHHYIFGGFDHVYTSKPLTEEQQKEYEQRAQESLAQCAAEISKSIDAEILKRIMGSKLP